MTLVEFHKKLFEIDLDNGVNTISLEKYLLACLTQLNINKDKEPSYELFLSMYDQSRDGQCEDFDPLWKEMNYPEEKWKIFGANINKQIQMEWEYSRDEIRFLITDLIHTKEVRGQLDDRKKSPMGEWDTERGLRFYNGTTPNSILKYTATRFEREYSPESFQEGKVTWVEFWNTIIIGIVYE